MFVLRNDAVEITVCRWSVSTAAYFLHFKCVGVVRSSVGVLDVLHNNIGLVRVLVDHLENDQHATQHLVSSFNDQQITQ